MAGKKNRQEIKRQKISFGLFILIKIKKEMQKPG